MFTISRKNTTLVMRLAEELLSGSMPVDLRLILGHCILNSIGGSRYCWMGDIGLLKMKIGCQSKDKMIG